MCTQWNSELNSSTNEDVIINWALNVPLYLDDRYPYAELCRRVIRTENRWRIRRKRPVLKKGSDKINKFVVNKVRHELTNYNEVVDGIARHYLEDVHFFILHYRILALIGSTYTELGSECARQQNLKLRKRRLKFDVQAEIDRRNSEMVS